MSEVAGNHTAGGQGNQPQKSLRDFIRDLITPVITETYGGDERSAALIDDLSWRIEGYYSSDRKDFIMRICWNWYPGGTTAANVAERIDTLLRTWLTDLRDRCPRCCRTRDEIRSGEGCGDYAQCPGVVAEDALNA